MVEATIENGTASKAKPCPLSPSPGRVVILRDEAAEMKGGVYMGGNKEKRRPFTGRVVAVGADVPDEFPVSGWKPGDRLLFHPHADNLFRIDGEMYGLLTGHDILGKINGEGVEVEYAECE